MFPAASERGFDRNLTRPLMTSHKPSDASDGQRTEDGSMEIGREGAAKADAAVRDRVRD